MTAKRKSWYNPANKEWIHSEDGDYREHVNLLADWGLVPDYDEDATIKALIKSRGITTQEELDSDDFQDALDEEYMSYLADQAYNALSEHGLVRAYQEGEDFGVQARDDLLTPEVLKAVLREYGGDPRTTRMIVENRGWQPIHDGTFLDFTKSYNARKPELVAPLVQQPGPLKSDGLLKDVYMDRAAFRKGWAKRRG